MNKIVFPRWDVDGSKCEQKELERWYLNETKDIATRLKTNVSASSNNQKRLLDHLIKYLPAIILMTPQRMQYYTTVINDKFKRILINESNRGGTAFGKQILAAFNYDNYRRTVLVELAQKLNVKTCSYCNMCYTLYSEERQIGTGDKKTVKKFAKFQFDHFYDKNTYPMLSMSVYNLIPCCPSCNQGKNTHALSPIFHPYANDIHSLFTFAVSSPIPAYSGEELPDHVEVKLCWDDSVSEDDRKRFEDKFHLSAMYSRHGDVVRETFDQAYMYPYYSNQAYFSFLRGFDKDYMERIIFGNYMTPKDIDKRPLAKFKQDIRKQAEGRD